MNLKGQDVLYNMLTKTSSLQDIQKYIQEMNHLRGFDEDEVEDRMLLLVEEVGELAKAIRKEKNTMGVDPTKMHHYSSSKEEVADVFYVLLSVCELLDIDIFEALLEKEEENRKRSWISQEMEEK